MKTKGLFTAVLCGVILLTGCGGDGRDPSENNAVSSQPRDVSESSEAASTDSSESVLSSNTEESSSSYETVSIAESSDTVSESVSSSKPVIEKMYFETDNMLGINFSGGLDSESRRFRVYCSPTEGDIGNCVFDDRFLPRVLNPPQGTYYYRLQMYTGSEFGEISDPYCFVNGEGSGGTVQPTTPVQPVKPAVHRYTHTFSAPNGVVAVPDYDDANADINRGKQPTSFDAKIYYICPYCGRENYFGTRTFDYSKDSRAFNVKAYCTINNCFGYNDRTSFHTIYCYAAQVS